jgi:prophage DNA circulation protein
MTIFDLPSVWRERLRPASYRGARFHCEVSTRESGRRIVEHEFPKKDLPYAEDMGRVAKQFTVRGYCITFSYDSGVALYARDYRIARERLRKVLDSEGAGALQLPTQTWEMVVCTRYRLTEEERFGGYCTFDMTFQEYGLSAQEMAAIADTQGIIKNSQNYLRDQLLHILAAPTAQQQIINDQRQQQLEQQDQ